jgi:2-polyprenyl-3-methyl-5-hydroxy-6-metoxy-1,4-benzoquinol methylase
LSNTTDAVRDFYDATVENEWKRIDGKPEFLFTTRIMARYIKPGDTVLGIGGGPGRYSLWLAVRGCKVTLLDLSPGNVKFAQSKAAGQNLQIKAIAGNALEADKFVSGEFDHVLLMGPLYHLLEESERQACVEISLKLLKQGGLIWAAFINLFSGVNWALYEYPAAIAEEQEQSYLQHVAENRSWAGKAFTHAMFSAPQDALALMARFPLDKLHFFNQEGIIGQNNTNPLVMQQSPEIIERWLEYSEKLLDMPEYYALAQHLMYVGRKASRI